jgi:sugar/nucleoside kinase (ribokinase family)
MNEKEFYHWSPPGFGGFRSKVSLVRDTFGVTSLILKRGENGASYYDGFSFYTVNGCDVSVVDTCGAGDAFLAAYVASGGDLHYANRWAALSVTKYGTEVPKLEEIEGIHEKVIP